VTITGWELAIVMAVCLCVGAAFGVVFMALIVAGRDGGHR
jgi:ABC-type xylose transport system permease subunit